MKLSVDGKAKLVRAQDVPGTDWDVVVALDESDDGWNAFALERVTGVSRCYRRYRIRFRDCDCHKSVPPLWAG